MSTPDHVYPPQAALTTGTGYSHVPLYAPRRWVVPLVVLLILGGVGLWTHLSIERAMKENMRGELETLLGSNVAALEIWLDSQRSVVRGLSGDATVRKHINDLVRFAEKKGAASEELKSSDQLADLRRLVSPLLRAEEYPGFMVLNREGIALAALRDQPLGLPVLKDHPEVLDNTLKGQAVVTRPFAWPLPLPDEHGHERIGRPAMLAAAPVVNDKGETVAVLALRIRPEQHFTAILQKARASESGETYAFDHQGVMISNSRFDRQLKTIGLLPETPDASSMLTIHIRDPGVDLTRGEKAKQARASQPLTLMAASAVAGVRGADVDGYRDYRGVPVVGAWTWLPAYGFGVATEMDVAEAYKPLFVLRTAFGVLFGVLLVAGAVVVIGTRLIQRMNFRIQRAQMQMQQLGQYTLERKIGSGGMGEVYQARHAMLRRPTAVKLLKPERNSEEAIARFEREVQATCQLTHPNTIMIYDYGRTPDNVFYYAMELLQGVSLNQLIGQEGTLPEGRVIHILRQACFSLREAHGIGLIHRDIKPANILLCERGGQYDLVKVLDFGLVKHIDQVKQGTTVMGLTQADAIAGTPQYLSPEAINAPGTIDARSDLYALGAVAYFLLTGENVFDGATPLEICLKHLKDVPPSPSMRVQREVDHDLETVIRDCLAKDPAQRPADAGALIERLEACNAHGAWTEAHARAWWDSRGREMARQHLQGAGDASASAAPSISVNLAQR